MGVLFERDCGVEISKNESREDRKGFRIMQDGK